METKEAFAKRLEIALDFLGVDRKQSERKRYLAKRLDITERHAGNYLHGAKLPTPEGAIDMAQVLDVNPNWLWFGNGPMKPLTPAQTAHIEAVQALPEPEQNRVFSVSAVLAGSGQEGAARAS